MILGTAQGKIIVDITPFTLAVQRMGEAIQGAGEAIADAMARAIYPDQADRLRWERSNGPLRPLQAPVRARQGKKGWIYLAMDKGAYRPVRRVTGLGWVYVDQWEKYQRASYDVS